MKRTIFFTILCILAAVSGFAQTNLQPAATINLVRTEAITVGQLRGEVDRMERSAGRPLNREERLQVLDAMINERLALQAAERDRIIVTENEVNQQIQQLRGGLAQQLGRQPTDAEYAQAVRNESGLDVVAFREQLRRQMIVQKYLESKKGHLFTGIRQPTDAEITAEYNIRRTQLVRPDTVRFSMINVPYGPDAASKARARELANRLFQEIGASASKFDEIAARGQIPDSGYQAGDAGYLPLNPEAREVFGQEFLSIAFSLTQGQVSRLIEGIQGYQIIKVTENYAERRLEMTDVFQLGTRVTVREYIGQVLLAQRQQAALAQATRELVSELRSGNSFQIFENNLNW